MATYEEIYKGLINPNKRKKIKVLIISKENYEEVIDVSDYITNYTETSSFGETSKFSLGNTPSKACSVSLYNIQFFGEDTREVIPRDILNYVFEIYFEVELDDGSIEEIYSGRYDVYERPKRFTEQMTIELNDCMASLDRTYQTSLEFPNTVLNMLVEIQDEFNVLFDFTTLDETIQNLSVESFDGTSTARKFVGWVAELNSSNAIVKDDNIVFQPFTNHVEKTMSMDYITDYVINDDVLITGVVFNNGVYEYSYGNYDGHVLFLSSDNPLIPKNPTYVEQIYHNVDGLKLVSFESLSTPYGNPLINLGETVGVYSHDDDDEETYKIICLGNELTYNGGISCKYSSDVSTIAQNLISNEISAEQKVEDAIEEVQEEIKNATENKLDVDLANIKTASIQKAVIEQLFTTKVVADVLESQYAKLDLANINVADISEATIKNLVSSKASIDELNTRYLQSSDASITNLFSSKIVTDILNAKYLQSDEASITNLFSSKIVTDNLDSKYAHLDFANVDVAEIDDAFIENLISSEITTNVLDAQYITTNTLIGKNVQTDVLNALVSNVTNGNTTNQIAKMILANGLMADKGTFEEAKIIGGNLSVYGFNNEEIRLDGATQYFYDENEKLRVVIGKMGTFSNYDMIVYDGDGNELFNAIDGIQYDGLKDKVATVLNSETDTTRIKADRLDIQGMVEEINAEEVYGDEDGILYYHLDEDGTSYDVGTYGRYKISGTSVFLDTESQTLDIMFANIDSEVGDMQTTIEAQNDKFKIVMSELGYDENDERFTRFSSIEQEVLGLTSTVSEYSENYGALSTIVNQTSQDLSINILKVNDIEQVSKSFKYDIDGLHISSIGSNNETVFGEDKISFMMNGIEVAYVSNNTFHIASGTVTNSLAVGEESNAWKWEASDEYGLTLKYIGN